MNSSHHDSNEQAHKAPQAPFTPSASAHKIPVVPVTPPGEDFERVNRLWSLLGAFVALVVIILIGWFAYTRSPAVRDLLTTGTDTPVTVNKTGTFDDFTLSASLPSAVPEREETRVEVTLTNTSLWKQTVGVGILEDGVFSGSGARRIVDMTAGQREVISLPFVANSQGSWGLRIGLYDEHEALIGFIERPVSVVASAFAVRLDMGEKAAIQVPKSGRVYSVFRYDARGATSTIPSVTLRFSTVPEKTVTLKNVKPGQQGHFTVWTTVPAPIRGQLVHTAALGLSVRATWKDIDGKDHTVERLPVADQVILSAFTRLYDSKGKRLSESELPLTVGKEATFWVNLGLDRETRDAKSVLIRAVLAPGVEFTGKTWVNNKDRISYDATTRTIVWQTYPLKAKDKNEPLAGFEVKMTPSADAAGTLPAVLSSLNADKNPLPNELREKPDVEIGSVLADFRFDSFAAAENGVRK